MTLNRIFRFFQELSTSGVCFIDTCIYCNCRTGAYVKRRKLCAFYASSLPRLFCNLRSTSLNTLAPDSGHSYFWCGVPGNSWLVVVVHKLQWLLSGAIALIFLKTPLRPLLVLKSRWQSTCKLFFLPRNSTN